MPPLPPPAPYAYGRISIKPNIPCVTNCIQCFSGASGFFVKHVQTGLCINDTSILQSQGSDWGNLSFLELSNDCLDPAAQFRFRDNGAMLNLKRQGCLAGLYKRGSGYFLDMFYLYVGAVSLDISACAQKPDKNIYRAITQTTWGGLSVRYRRTNNNQFQTRCAVNGHYKQLAENQGINPYLKLTSCTDASNKRFHFGKFLSRNVLRLK